MKLNQVIYFFKLKEKYADMLSECIQGVQVFKTYTEHFDESESVFQKYPYYIRSKDTGCLMNFIQTFN